jgi:hypothetical protein
MYGTNLEKRIFDKILYGVELESLSLSIGI